MEKETRVYSLHEIEVREEGDNSTEISGYAATYDSYSKDLGGFTEVIERGFFDNALESSDVVSLWNHNSDKPLGRQSAGTLKIATLRSSPCLMPISFTGLPAVGISFPLCVTT